MTKCACLRRNQECTVECECSSTGKCRNRGVTARAALKMDADVREVNAWGIDCYTRRNIMDGALFFPLCLFLITDD